MTLDTATYLTLLAPLAGFLVIALAGMKLPARPAGWLASGAVLLGFVGALGALLQRPTDHGQLLSPYTWLQVADFTVGFDLFVDELSIFMALVVTGVGFLIHVYSIGYMHDDPQERRFYAYLNLFVFAMLMLVLAGNIAMLIVGWGLVGMASYLLIGFWHHRPTAVAAAKKAFIMNAAGDVSLMIGLYMIFVRAGTLTYPGIFETLPAAVTTNGTSALLICLLLLGGALAKSAQLPLHTWLPDAMEGPTPVSALIHAATMVTAGVYLIARFAPVFDLSEAAQLIVALIGAVTLVVAGFIALAQVDIKRVIAYSTMSQIGYMFVAVGVGAYSAGMFHLMTHAFFKALLFLGAGVVIHALAGEQDIRRMGGLKEAMPKTYWLFLIASLSLAGIIPFSGFFSKDEILAFAFASGELYGAAGYLVFALGLVGVVLTGIYTFRLFYLVFHGVPGAATTALLAGGAHAAAVESTTARSAGGAAAAADVAGHTAQHGAHAAHAEHGHHGEGPGTMMGPVIVLGVLSAIGGLIVIPGVWNLVHDFVGHAVPDREGLPHLSTGTHWVIALLVSTPLAIVGIAIATLVYKTGRLAHWRERVASARPAAEQAFYFDALYDRLFYRPASAVAAFAGRAIEGGLIAPSMDWVARAVRGGAAGVGALQSGLVRFYTFATALAVTLVVIWLVWAKG